jgi:hypothetical protein
VGSSNLTFAGLAGQGELNIDVVDQDAAQKPDQHVPHPDPDLGDDAVGPPQSAQLLDDILAVHVSASSA